MQNKSLAVLGGSALLLVGAMALGSQERVEPPEPPDPPEIVEAPEPPEPPVPPDNFAFFFADGGAWLGVRLSDVTAEMARELKLPGEYGAHVDAVEENSPAAKAGLLKGDVVLEFAGERVISDAQLQRLVRETPPGRTVELKISRNGQIRTLSVKLEAGNAGFGTRAFRVPEVHVPEIHIPEFKFDIFPGAARLGIDGEDLTRQLADYFGVKQGKGVLVREVMVGSAAEKAGLRAGDVVVRVDKTDVGSVEELRRALPRDLEAKRKVELTIVRDHREQTLAVELEPASPHPLRRAEIVQPIRDYTEELQRQASELRQQASRMQQEMQKFRLEWEKEAPRWQEELRRFERQWQVEGQKIRDELKRENLSKSLGAREAI